MNSDGTISTGDRDVCGQPKHFREVAPLVFRNVNGWERVAFRKDSNGRMRMAVDYPFMVFDKAPWYEAKIFNRVILYGVLGVLLLTVLLWPVGALVRWHYARRLNLAPGENRPRLLVRIASIVVLIFALAWLQMLSSLSDISSLTSARDPLFRLIQLLGWLGVIGTLAALWYGWDALRRPHWWWFNRVHAVSLAVAFVAFTWFVYHWHMLAFSSKY